MGAVPFEWNLRSSGACVVVLAGVSIRAAGGVVHVAVVTKKPSVQHWRPRARAASGPHPSPVRPGQKCNDGAASANLHRSGRIWGQQLLVGDQRVSHLGRVAEVSQRVLLVQRADLISVLPARLIEHPDVVP